MFRFIHKTSIPVLVLIIFGLQSVLLTPDGYAQGLMKTADVPGGGGGGSSNQSNDSGGGSTALLVIGGVIIAGFLFYKLVLNKDEPKKEEKEDSTSNESLLLRSSKNFASDVQTEYLKKLQEIPINVYLGYQQIDPVIPEKRFIMGVSYNF
ncbi:MAG TPA: hypothetical protein VKD08_10935 [Ignavibacteriaceae bacterium]|nr:hypothetical protein [Ignavibacteriaceae bacterium]